MTFWIIAAGLALAAGALLVLSLLRARGHHGPAAAYDVEVYRDQLKEVDRDLARGLLSEDEAQRVRIEVSRRLLEADKEASATGTAGRAPKPVSLVGAGVMLLAVVGGAFGLYRSIGAPGYGDLPLAARIERADEARANRPGQAEAETAAAARRPPVPEADPAFLELMDKLRAALAERQDDIEGFRLLAQNEARLGNFVAAYQAQERVLQLLGDQARGSDYADLGDLMILAAGGYVSPEAEAALQAALDRDPRNGAARYYMGLMYAQTARPDLAFQIWRQLLAESTPDAPWVPPIEAQIEEAAQLAGVRYTPPARSAPIAGAGPTREQMEAAAEMSPEERMDMVRGMVDGLSDRLATEGGPAEDWARLIGALGVLGETERAQAIWDEAQQVFAEVPDGLATIRAAAERAGLVN